MVSMVSRWGNSLALRLPQPLAKELQLTEGAEVDLVVENGTLVIRPRVRRRYTLEDLVAGITPENLHAEIDSGSPQGNEIW
jgi:antitoxin MazE